MMELGSGINGSSGDGTGDVAVDATLKAQLKGLPYYMVRNFWVFLIFLAFVVARYVQLGARRDILAQIRIEFLLGMTVIIFVGMQLGSRKPEIGESKPILISIALLFGAMLIQLPLAADPVLAREIFLDRVVKFAILTFLMVMMIESPRYLRMFLAVFLFSVFYITFEAVRGLISGGLVWENQGIQRLHGAVPIYQHANSLGGVAMGSLPFVVFLFPIIKNWLLRLGLLALTATSLVCVIYSGSRTAYLGLLAFIIWWWFQSANKGKFLIKLFIFGAVFLSIIPDQYIERFKSIGGQEKEGRSTETRIVILEDALTIFLENPLGVGVASFSAARIARFGRHQDTHNLYLEVATNLGIQGLLIFLAMIWVIMAAYRRSLIYLRSQKDRLKPLLFDEKVPIPVKRKILEHGRDLDFLIAVAQSAGGFILIRLVLGMFGMDLYEVYWWFGSGLAIILTGLAVNAEKNTLVLQELVKGSSGNF